MANEVNTVPPAVSDFLTEYHTLRDDHNKALQKIEDLEHIIATQDDQIMGYRRILEEVSAKSDHYMRLSVEMRTHFAAAQAIMREAEKCFVTGPYRNNGAVSKEALQVVADDINNNTEVKEIPGFLTNEDRKNTLNDLKGEPKTDAKMPKGKSWPVKNENGNTGK